MQLHTLHSRRQAFVVFPVAVLLSLLLSVSCYAAEYTQSTISTDVEQAFMANEIYPEYRYFYFNGNDYDRPQAIVGIHEKYTVDAPFWSGLEPTSEKLAELVSTMAFPDYVRSLEGGTIMDDQNNPIGVWFAAGYDISLEIKYNNNLILYNPSPPDEFFFGGGSSPPEGF